MHDTFTSFVFIQSPRGSYKIRLPQYQNGETGGQIQNDGTLPPHISNGGSSSMAALYGFPPYQSQYQGQDSHMNMSSSQNMTGNGGGNGVDYSSACNMNMSSHSSNIGQGQNPNSIGHNNAGNSDGQSMIPGYSLPTGIPMGGGNNGQSTLGAINGTVGTTYSFFHPPETSFSGLPTSLNLPIPAPFIFCRRLQHQFPGAYQLSGCSLLSRHHKVSLAAEHGRS